MQSINIKMTKWLSYRNRSTPEDLYKIEFEIFGYFYEFLHFFEIGNNFYYLKQFKKNLKLAA
jgi:hypothetical protein